MGKKFILNNFLCGQLARTMRRQIQAMALIDTKELYDTIFVSGKSGQKADEIYINVHCMYYYLFLDEGTINLPAFKITEKWWRRGDTQKTMQNIVESWFEWRFKEKIDMDGLQKVNPRLFITFEWIDDPYNGLPKPSYRF